MQGIMTTAVLRLEGGKRRGSLRLGKRTGRREENEMGQMETVGSQME